MRAPVRTAVLLAALVPALVPALARAQTVPPLPAGPHAIGYRLAYVVDSTRTALPDTTGSAPARAPSPRVLPLRIWYPAAAASRARPAMRYGDYLDVRPDGGGPAPAVADSLRERTLGLLRFVGRHYGRALGAAVAPADTAGLVARLLATPRPARRAAPPAPGRFPVLVFAGGAYHSVDENVALWEHLASRGWLVAAVPSVGVDAALADGAGLPADDAGLETMTRDVEAVIAHLAREPQADRARLAAGGFSFGGAAALVAATRGRWVDAVVGLDASFIGGMHTDRVRRAAHFAPARVAVPVLDLHRADTTVDLRVVESLARAPRWSVEYAGLGHVDFNSYALLLRPLLPPGAGPAYAARDSAVAARAAAYAGMVAAVAGFLDACVAGRAARDPLASLAAAPGVRVRALPAADGRGCAWSGAPAR